MDVPDLTTRRDDRDPTHLQRILLGGSDPVTAQDPFGAAPPNRRARNIHERTALHLEQSVRLFRVVDEQTEWDVLFGSEVSRHVGSAHPDSHYVGAFGFELRVPVAQLRGILPAERSAVVTEPDHDYRLLGP
jgi:hypothetical protein